MLEWFKRRRHKSVLPESSGVVRSRVAVSFDEYKIRVTMPNGVVHALNWDAIGAVNIVTTSDGPMVPDLFWLLQSPDRKTSLTIPMGAEGEHDLLLAMQSRLPGFDNMAVVEAMSSTGPAGFIVWDPEHAVESV